MSFSVISSAACGIFSHPSKISTSKESVQNQIVFDSLSPPLKRSSQQTPITALDQISESKMNIKQGGSSMSRGKYLSGPHFGPK